MNNQKLAGSSPQEKTMQTEKSATIGERLTHLKIGSKLTLGFGILILLMFINAGVSYQGSHKVTLKINQTGDVRVPAALAASRAQANLLRMLGDVRGYLALGDQQYQQSYMQSTAAFETNVAELRDLYSELGKQNQARLNKLEQVYEQWAALPQQLFALRDDQLDREPAYRLLAIDGVKYAGQVLIAMNTLIETQGQREATAENLELLQNMAKFQGNFTVMLSALRSYVTTRNDIYQGEYEVNLFDNQNAWERLTTRQDAVTPIQGKLLEEMGQNREAFLQLPEELFEILESEQWRLDLYMFRTEAVMYTNKMQQLLGEMTEDQQTLLKNELGEGRQALTTANRGILTGGIVALMLGVAMSLMFRENIAGPIRRLTAVAEQIRAGDMEAQACVESNDEIGILAETFNKMTAQERKRSENALVEERNLLRALIDNLPDHIYVKDIESRFLVANEAIARTMGMTTPDDLIGKTDFDFYPSEMAEQYYANERVVIESGNPLFNQEELNVNRKTGMTIWYLTSTVPYLDSQGKIVGLVGIARDITVRKRAEETMAEMALFAEMNPAPILRTDLDGTISLANRAANELFKDHHLIGNSWYVLCPAVERKDFNQLSHRGGTLQHEYRIGEQDFLFTYLSNLDYGLVHIYGTDITQLKHLEAQLFQSQKMEAIGQLAGGIAHDFNTLLEIILGYGDMMRDDLPESSLLRDNLEEILEAGQRAKALVRQLLDFARPSGKTRRPIPLSSVVEDSLRLLRSSLPTTITIRQHIEATSSTVLADPTQIAQVIMNLGMNAGNAIGGQGGEIEITLIEAEVDTTLAEPQAVSPGSYAKLRVSDTGCGMTPKIYEHIFEPFFTTKDIGKGLGLGLSIVHGIVKSHGGFITVESKPGKGSRFQVYLPKIED